MDDSQRSDVVATDGPELSDVIGKLRKSLIVAQKQGDDKDLRFVIEDIEVELQVAVTKEGNGEAGVKFWVVEAKAGGKLGNATTQKIKLRMKLVDGNVSVAAGEVRIGKRESKD